jgi:hypothetical protein
LGNRKKTYTEFEESTEDTKKKSGSRAAALHSAGLKRCRCKEKRADG